MTKNAIRRGLFVLSLALGGALAGRSVVACNDNPIITAPTCAPGGCSCDEDPSQATCKGFNEREEGGKDPADATPVNPTDGSEPEDAGETDGGEDAGEDADAT